MDEAIKKAAGYWNQYLCRKLEDIIYAETIEEVNAAQYFFSTAIKRMYMCGYPIEVLTYYSRLYALAEKIIAMRDSDQDIHDLD